MIKYPQNVSLGSRSVISNIFHAYNAISNTLQITSVLLRQVYQPRKLVSITLKYIFKLLYRKILSLAYFQSISIMHYSQRQKRYLPIPIACENFCSTTSEVLLRKAFQILLLLLLFFFFFFVIGHVLFTFLERF